MAEFVRMGDSIKDAILTIIIYLSSDTGAEPTQEEVAELLKSYFIVNEVGNQIRYQLKKQAGSPGAPAVNSGAPLWTLNLKSGPAQNMLVRAGVFHRSIKEAIDATRLYVKKTTGAVPDDDVVARSLKSSFILSEIKNQYDYQRRQTPKKIKSSAPKAPSPQDKDL